MAASISSNFNDDDETSFFRFSDEDILTNGVENAPYGPKLHLEPDYFQI